MTTDRNVLHLLRNMERKRYVRKVQYVVDDLEAAFALCREADCPLVVELRDPQPNQLPHPDATQFKVYPSGYALWAFDGENPFQTWPD